MISALGIIISLARISSILRIFISITLSCLEIPSVLLDLLSNTVSKSSLRLVLSKELL